MQLQLNLELSDEQYEKLMNSSYEKVFNDEETIALLRKTIVEQMAKYISDHPSIIDDYFRPKGVYDKKYNPTAAKLIDEAGKEAAEAIRNAIYSMMINTVKDPKTNIETIVLNMLVRGVMDGMLNGTRDWMNMSASSMNCLMEMLRGHNVLYEIPHTIPEAIVGIPDEIDPTKGS